MYVASDNLLYGNHTMNFKAYISQGKHAHVQAYCPKGSMLMLSPIVLMVACSC